MRDAIIKAHGGNYVGRFPKLSGMSESAIEEAMDRAKDRRDTKALSDIEGYYAEMSNLRVAVPLLSDPSVFIYKQRLKDGSDKIWRVK